MAKIVVLVRHGKAKDRTECTDIPDEKRKLTRAGKRSLAAWLPRAAKLIEADSSASIELWASPAVRTMQTAKAVRKAVSCTLSIKPPDITPCDFLLSQDMTAFLKAVEDSEANIVFAVGHNPFIEEACEQLSGARIPFGTGAVAAIECYGSSNESPDDSAHLMWFMQGPDSKRWKNLVDMEDILADAGNEVLEQRDMFLENPEDAETLHHLRISIRTLRSLLTFAEPFMKSSQFKSMQQDLRDLVLVTSHLRELDVLAEQTSELDPPASSLLAACAILREEECENVKAGLAAPGAAKRFERVLQQSHNIVWKKRVEQEGLGRDDLDERLAELSDQTYRMVQSVDLADSPETHNVRKRAKKVRYAAEQFGKLTSLDTHEISHRMKGAQDRLGALCDARVNVDIIDRFPVDDLPEEALWDLSLLRTRNLELLYSTLRSAMQNEGSSDSNPVIDASTGAAPSTGATASGDDAAENATAGSSNGGGDCSSRDDEDARP